MTAHDVSYDYHVTHNGHRMEDPYDTTANVMYETITPSTQAQEPPKYNEVVDKHFVRTTNDYN